jgi:hypothetical protein
MTINTGELSCGFIMEEQNVLVVDVNHLAPSTLAQGRALVTELLDNALSDGTLRQYRNAYQRWIK